MHSHRLRIAGSIALMLALNCVRLVSADEVGKPDPTDVGRWRKELLELRKLFVTGKTLHPETWDLGREKISAIDEPAAVHAIAKILETETNGQFRRALLKPLISIGGNDAAACLVKWSVEDQNPLLRQEACHGLTERKELPEFLNAYIGYLKPVRQGRNVRFATEAAEALTMTRLAAPLGQGERPNAELVRALASALDTAPVFIKQIDSTPVKNFIPDPRDSRERQKRKTPLAGVVPTVDTPNPVVLATLQEYTGADFQYDEKAWLAWLDEKLKD
jgi:hypothetical protein